jgi:hypothetical protein
MNQNEPGQQAAETSVSLLTPWNELSFYLNLTPSHAQVPLLTSPTPYLNILSAKQ